MNGGDAFGDLLTKALERLRVFLELTALVVGGKGPCGPGDRDFVIDALDDDAAVCAAVPFEVEGVRLVLGDGKAEFGEAQGFLDGDVVHAHLSRGGDITDNAALYIV